MVGLVVGRLNVWLAKFLDESMIIGTQPYYLPIYISISPSIHISI